MDKISWADVAHYGGAVALYAVGIAGVSGLHVPGVTIDPTVCFTTASAWLASGLVKGGVTTGDKK